jgi:polyisoprenoid-binding protein YceI
MRTTTLLALSALLVAPALAAPVTFTVEPTHTYPRFSYNHLGLSTQLSRFNNTSGTVVYDATARTASIDISIDMKSVDTGSAEFDEKIQKPGLFDTARFPTATYKSTAVKFNGDKPASVEGILTINGVSKPVTLTVTSFTNKTHLMQRKEAIGADAYAVVKRSDFNAGRNVPFVGDEVVISIALEAIAH